MTSILNALSSIFTSVIDMVDTVGETVVGNDVLLMFALIPLIGIGVGLFKRLINVN